MELFIGLAIEEKLGGEKIAPRPFINLDMSSVSIRKGADYFVKSLGRKTVEIARLLKVGVPKRLAPEEIFSSLIIGAYEKYDAKVAVLIDEYDATFTKLFVNGNN